MLTPTLATPPVLVGAMRDDADPQADFEAQKAFTPWTSAWNVTGMPAVSLPLHWTPDGLPVGVMLAARPAEEELLLALARPGRGGRALGRPEAAGMVILRPDRTARRTLDGRPPQVHGGWMPCPVRLLCLAGRGPWLGSGVEHPGRPRLTDRVGP